MPEESKFPLSENNEVQPSALPATIPLTELVLRRTQATMGLLREVMLESSIEYWYNRAIEHKMAEEWEAAASCFGQYNDLSGGSLIAGVFQGICYAHINNPKLCAEALFKTQNYPEDALYSEYVSWITEQEWYLLFRTTNYQIVDRILDPVASMNHHQDYGSSIISYVKNLLIDERNSFLINFSASVSVLYNQFISSHWFDDKSENFYYRFGQNGPQSEFFYKFDLAIKLAEQLKGVEISKTFWPISEGTIWEIYEQESFKCQHLFDAHIANSFLRAIIKWMTGLHLIPKVIIAYNKVFSIE